MTSAVQSLRAQSFQEILAEPYIYADDMLRSAFRTQGVAVSAMQEGSDFCATLIDLASRAIKVIVGLILIIPLINIVVLQIFRFFNFSAFAPVNSEEIDIPREILSLGVPSPEEMALNEEFREMTNRGEVLAPEDMEPLPEVSAAEFQQRKTDLIQALTNPETPLAVENYRCADEVGRFDLDAILGRYRTDHPHRSLELLFEYANVPARTRRDVHNDFDGYIRRDLSLQERNAAHCFSRLYDFLSQKKVLFQNHPKEALFKAEIRCIFEKIRNAHNNCIDQVRSQLETIIVETIASYDAMRTSGSSNRTAFLRCMAARALLSHKLGLISEICVKEYPRETHFVVLEREAKRLLAPALGLSGQMFESGAYYSNLIRDMEGKAGNVAEIFLHGRPLERYRRAGRDYAADQYQPEKFLMNGTTVSQGCLISFGTSILQWATNYFKLGEVGEVDEQTAVCIELISANNDGMTADMGGDLKPEAFLYFLAHLGIFERRPNLAV